MHEHLGTRGNARTVPQNVILGRARDRCDDNFLRRVLDQPLALRLYVATDGSESGIVEASGGGYRPEAVRISDWDLKAGRAEGPVREFRFDGSSRLRVLGAYLTESDGEILWAKAFDKPIIASTRGDLIPVRPIIRMGAIS